MANRQDQSSAQYSAGQDPRAPNNFSSSATPTSEYGIPQPQSARSGTFPDYIRQQQQQPYPQTQGAPGGNMAHASSPLMPMKHQSQANSHHAPHGMKSDNDVPIDPSIAAASPTYPPQHHYSPHQPFPQHEAGGMYPMAPADYAARQWPPGHYQTPTHMPHYGGHPVTTGPPTPSMVSPVRSPHSGGHPLSTVYSFVPIPGAQQHKRPRRRYEEIERMYKCGWQGCEKAYGTLNHLNAHVTMQSHGAKRTPEEFKEIRKEWKARKKEEEAARKADEDRMRQSAESRGSDQQAGAEQQAVYGHMRTPVGGPPSMGGGPQLPPIGYAPAGAQSQAQYGQPSPAMDGPGMPQYARPTAAYGSDSNNSGSYPQSPYGQPGQMR